LSVNLSFGARAPTGAAPAQQCAFWWSIGSKNRFHLHPKTVQFIKERYAQV
jgi:hypothetical protein